MSKVSPRTRLIAAVVFFSFCCGILGQASAAPEGMTERTNPRNVRYCEILVATRHGMTATAGGYNTLRLNDCPADKWTALDTNKLPKELKATAVVLNGPRDFVMDRNALRNPGYVKSFDGLQARLLAQLEIKAKQKRAAYTEHIVDRENQYVYERGKDTYELISADGRIYIMQSYSQESDRSLNEQGLQTLATRLKLLKGWQYRVRRLDADLVVRNSDGQAHVIQDDLQNSYQLGQ